MTQGQALTSPPGCYSIPASLSLNHHPLAFFPHEFALLRLASGLKPIGHLLAGVIQWGQWFVTWGSVQAPLPRVGRGEGCSAPSTAQTVQLEELP